MACGNSLSLLPFLHDFLRYHLSSKLKGLLFSRSLFCLLPLPHAEATAHRYQLADDHVLFQAAQLIAIAAHRGSSQHAGRLLERSRRQEAAGVQGRFGEPQELHTSFRRLAIDLMCLLIHFPEMEAVLQLAGQEAGVSSRTDAHPTQHLADDDLDVLVVNDHALGAIDFLHFFQEVKLTGLVALDAQHLFRILRPFGQLIARLHPLSLLDTHACRGRDRRFPHLRLFAACHCQACSVIRLLPVDVAVYAGQDLGQLGSILPAGDDRVLLHAVAIINAHVISGGDEMLPLHHVAIRHLDLALFPLPVDVHQAVYFADDRLALGVTGFEKLFHAGQTLGDVLGARHTTRVERAQRELGARLADGLRGDDAHSLTHVDRATAGQVLSVTMATHAKGSLTGQGGTDIGPRHASFIQLQAGLFVDKLSPGHQCPSCLRMDNGSCCHTPHDALNELLADIHLSVNPDADRGATVLDAHDHVLRHVHQTPCEIARVGRTQSGIGQPFARTMRAEEVLQCVQAFAEVGADGQGDDTARRIGHQAAHAGQLPNGLDAAFRRARGHHRAQASRRVQILPHLLGDIVAGSCPQLNDLVVLLLFRDQATAVLPFRFLHQLFRARQDV